MIIRLLIEVFNLEIETVPVSKIFCSGCKLILLVVTYNKENKMVSVSPHYCSPMGAGA